jgi:hypothetical protein
MLFHQMRELMNQAIYVAYKLTMVIVCNSNDENTPNTNCEFQLKNGGLNSFRIYTHYIKCIKKIVQFFKILITSTFSHLMERARFFFSKFAITILENN